MKSKGTKQTQGINGDAAALQSKMDTALKYSGISEDSCPYPAHRQTDWRLEDQVLVVCGVCHPPARGLRFIRIGAMP